MKGGVFLRTNSIDVDSWAVLERLLMPANALVIETMLRTGLRVSDVLAIRTSQLRLRFTVTESKTGKRKQLYLGKDLYARLKAQSGEVYVFEAAHRTDKHRTRQAVWYDVKRAARAMRIPVCVGTHSARKSFAVSEYAKCHNIGTVQRKLNHDNLETTILYLLDVFGGLGGLPPFSK